MNIAWWHRFSAPTAVQPPAQMRQQQHLLLGAARRVTLPGQLPGEPIRYALSGPLTRTRLGSFMIASSSVPIPVGEASVTQSRLCDPARQQAQRDQQVRPHRRLGSHNSAQRIVELMADWP